MPELNYRDDEGEHVSVELEGREMVIGRLPECDIVLAKPYVSRRHARVFRESGTWYVEDLGSAGGTFLNRTPLTQRGTLVDGDEIGIGDLRVTFSTPELVGKRTVQRPSAPVGRGAKATALAGPVPEDAEDPFAATNPAFVLPGDGATGAVEAAGPKKPVVGLRHAAGSGAWSRLAAKSRSIDPAKALTPDRTGSLVDTNVAGAALRFAAEIVGGEDRAAVHRRALILALRAIGGDRAALAVRRDSDGAYVTAGSVVASSGKFADATFQIDPELVSEVVGAREAIIAQEGDEAVADARTVRPTDVRTLLCSPFIDKDRVAGWIYVDARGLRTDLDASALDLIAFIGATAAQAASLR